MPLRELYWVNSRKNYLTRCVNGVYNLQKERVMWVLKCQTLHRVTKFRKLIAETMNIFGTSKKILLEPNQMLISSVPFAGK